jgi:hypothetical protein
MRSMLVVLWWATSASAGPGQLSHQGRLLGADGAPVEGTVTLHFKLYASSTATSALWSETDTLAVQSGYYATTLGDNGTPALTTLDWATGALWLGVTVGSGTEMPRTELHATARALPGPVNVSGSGTCDAGATGTIRYASGALQVCDGTDWAGVATGSGGGGGSGSCAPGRQTFLHTGTDQAFVVPTGCTALRVEAWGAGGGGGYDGNPSPRTGGAGGYASAAVTVTPGESFVVVVGGGGPRNTTTGTLSAASYGFGGAGQADSTCAVGNGGGLSGLFRGSAVRTGAVVVAGGGGGSSGYTWGGPGNDPLYGGGQSGLLGASHAGVWVAGGGGGYNGGNTHTRSTTNGTYPGGNGGAGFTGGIGVIAGTATLLSGTFQSNVPPRIGRVRYPGVGTSGASAVGYGGQGGVYGVNCASAGHGAVVLSWSDGSPIGTQGNPAISCQDLYEHDPGRPDGLAWIQPAIGGTPFEAWCDFDANGGWTLVGRYINSPANGNMAQAAALGTLTSPTQPSYAKLADSVWNELRLTGGAGSRMKLLDGSMNPVIYWNVGNGIAINNQISTQSAVYDASASFAGPYVDVTEGCTPRWTNWSAYNGSTWQICHHGDTYDFGGIYLNNPGLPGTIWIR